MISVVVFRMGKFVLDEMNHVWNPENLGPIDFYGRSKLYQVLVLYACFFLKTTKMMLLFESLVSKSNKRCHRFMWIFRTLKAGRYIDTN